MLNIGNNIDFLNRAIQISWSKIMPFWPIKKIVAANPVGRFEDLPFEEGLKYGKIYFQQQELPKGMQNVNRESIKWLQAFCDEGQSTIQMPYRHLGFLKSTLSLIIYDYKIHNNNLKKIQWLKELGQDPNKIISMSLSYLSIKNEDWIKFLTLMLTTLPGWASYIQYLSSWACVHNENSQYKITRDEYMAFRLVLAYLMWDDGSKDLIAWHNRALKETNIAETYESIVESEIHYQKKLIEQFVQPDISKNINRPKAQLAFCIDARSEPFRRAIESQGDYNTYGVAGFFGIATTIKDSITKESYAICPAFLKPKHIIITKPNRSIDICKNEYNRMQQIKKLYQSIKYNFATSFILAGILGVGMGIWMGLKSLMPNIAPKIQNYLQSCIATHYESIPYIDNISQKQQISYALKLLKLMGLKDIFAPLVILCAHGSSSHPNAHSTILNCGACSGQNGLINARIMANILNSPTIRECLAKKDIHIPHDTLFIAAEHNTVTDKLTIDTIKLNNEKEKQIENLRRDLQNAEKENCQWRMQKMYKNVYKSKAAKLAKICSQDWSKTRPEWGLARNASFIIAPRSFTKNINLEGRSFLQSYCWENDNDSSLLTSILTSSTIVVQWINSQYLFSTLDNVAFGSGSKVTQNITGKIGIMQGNASDLMHGLPFQFVYKSDKSAYHKPIRITVIVYTPKSCIARIIREQKILQKLFGNGWAHLICYDPNKNQKYVLNKNLEWSKWG